MIVRRTPLAAAVSLAMGATLPALAAEYEGEDYGYVPKYQYVNLDQWSHHREEGEYLHCTGDCFTVDASQYPITDPIFLLVGLQRDDHYERQNPESIVTLDRDAVQIMGGEWPSAIIANTSTISASGHVEEPGYEPIEATAIVFDSTRVTGLAASDQDASILNELPVFANGDARVVIFNAGTISSEHNAFVIMGEDYEGDDFPTFIEGSIINRAGSGAESAIISAENGNALSITYTRLNGNIVNGLVGDTGTATISGGEHAIFLSERTIMQGDIINRGLIEAHSGSAINIEDSQLQGNIVNTGTLRTGSGEPAIRIHNTTGDIVIDQRGTLTGLRETDLGTELGQAMDLSGQNIHVRLSDGRVRGDIRFVDATVTLRGGEYEGTITNEGGLFVVEGLQRIDGAYEQDAAATLALSSDQVSRLSANRIMLADGSTLVVGNGEAYRDYVDGREAVLLEGSLDFDLDTIEILAGSGLLRIQEYGTIATGESERFYVIYSGLDGQTIARESSQRSGATGAKAKQLRGLGRALDNVLLRNDQAAQVIGQNIERLEELLPDTSGAVSSATGTATQAGTSAVSTRARGVAAGDTLAGQGVWIKGLYGEVGQRQRDGIEGFDSDTQGFVLGGDAELTNGTVLGLAWARTNTDVTGRNGLTESEVEFDQLSAYTSRAYGNWLFDAQLSYGHGTNDISRRVMGSTAHASFDSNQMGAQAAAGYEWQFDTATRLTPRVSLNYANLELDAYEESGAGALNLRNEEQRIERLELGLEGEFAHLTQLGGLMVEPRFTLGAYHDFQGDAHSSISSFAFAPEETRFVVEGPEADKTRYNAGLGLDVYSAGGFTTSLDYGYGWTSNMSTHAGSLQLRYDF
ncbi:autotransporter outer membrane beta-barrel domain-containing protein [Billgrantia sp. LNSP4103-1]|uniref:autotransporter outer membrane beta-barrel domain-containing protein n=1 Tax=Billgrantia sp. LNSP4103-1 TaxID=3410266 RepID=UPI00403F2CC5